MKGSWPSKTWCPYWRVCVFAPPFPEDARIGNTQLYQEPYLSKAMAVEAMDRLKPRVDSGELHSLELLRPDGYVKTPESVRLPIYGEREADRVIRDIRAEPGAFGTWLFARRDYGDYLDRYEKKPRNREADLLVDLFWTLDILDNPYDFSLEEVESLAWRHACAHNRTDLDEETLECGTEEPTYEVDGSEPACESDSCVVSTRLLDVERFLEKCGRLFLRDKLRERYALDYPENRVRHECVGEPLAVLVPPDMAGVYFVRAHDRVKIGKATNIRKRVCELQTSAPVKLELTGWVDGGLAEESALHKRFKPLRTVGEWFRLSGELVPFLTGINQKLRPEHCLKQGTD